MDAQGFDRATLRSLGTRLIEEASATEPLPVQVSADGLVSVIMGPRLEITSLTLAGLDLSLDRQARLEQALTTAVNEAIRKVAAAQEAHFRGLVERAGAT